MSGSGLARTVDDAMASPAETAAPASAGPVKLSFSDFVVLTCEVAKKDRNDCIIAGLKAKSREYSLMADKEAGNLDSLGVTETFLNIEEVLGRHLGRGDAFEIPEKVTEDSKNIGETYVAVCGLLGIEPDFETPLDFSGYLDPAKPVTA